MFSISPEENMSLTTPFYNITVILYITQMPKMIDAV